MNLAATLGICLAVVLVSMTLMWFVSLAKKDASIVDPFWGTGFILAAATVSWLNEPISARSQLLMALVFIWGLRLSIHLLRRNLHHGEDRRYGAMRRHHGERFWWVSFLTVFMLQGVILWFVALPIQIAAVKKIDSPWNWLDAVGVTVWSIGLFFESVGDWQLARFKANSANAGKIMRYGLWRLTRHPNYFGDFCIWWGIYLVACSGGAAWTIASPLLMSWLLMRVSGVPMLERGMNERFPDYAEYVQRTNSFFPWLPKK